MKNYETTTSISSEWYTPKSVFDLINLKFELDPCHPIERNFDIPCKNVLTKLDNGLVHEWYGTVYCNPPFGKDLTKWIQKFTSHNNGVMLLPARTDTKWFHELVTKCDVIVLLKGRVKFIDGFELTKLTGNTCGTILVSCGTPSNEALLNISGHFVIDNRKLI